MANVRRPRHGTKQYWPRKKAKRPYTLIKSWPDTAETKFLGFAGYKAGMTHIILKDSRPHSDTKGETISWPVTVLECPPLKLFSIKLYKKTAYGTKTIIEAQNPKLDKELKRRISATKNQKINIGDLEKKIPDATELMVKVYTQPKKTGLGKKKPELFEMAIGGVNLKLKLDYAKQFLDKEISINEVIKPGTKVDIHAVTKGKGFQGSVKRWGVNLRQHKSEKKRRGVTLGTTSPGKIRWGMLSPGKMGYEKRTEYNKDVIKIDTRPENINPSGGFKHYGLIKNDYILIKGSIPGSTKRLIRFIDPIRKTKGFGTNIEIVSINKDSKQ